jgi:hypothetical protein
MTFGKFIHEYQTLIGSFLAIFSTIMLWYFKEVHEKNKQLQNNKKEIEDLFFMASREAEESVMDLIDYADKLRKNLGKKENVMDVFQHLKFNKVYINQERLFVLKQGASFILSQQIDIAVTAANKFNGILEGIEFGPTFIFDSTIKLIEAGVETKELAIKNYIKDQEAYVKNIEFMLDHHIKKAQILMLRPLAAMAPKYENVPDNVDVDKQLDLEAELILSVIKKDLE